ncbi:hypothetical protein FBY31_4506 [Arthrobacter sp. SLBN-100]|uniref:DUF6036 family nucleotidyltransferase n=1 Tax=Arthrobacter sp. SLBN-100 TaxID=2768450 RepID=UPI001152896B|nr:DUF6036 family nucleotidyltransferase [Arthrobacter sp. SLBN-100]TQJ62122.1 hypothetical protein FBY31_4506 [Arthrobacter sp. SLBN-100]
MRPGRRASYGPDDIRELLLELSRRLQAWGGAADIYLVGGAAIAVEFDSRRSTTDIDAVYLPEQTVQEIATEMASDVGLDPRWLNNAARAYIPDGEDSEAAEVAIADNLMLRVASPRFLLAMKLAAGRDRDIPDIAVLCRTLNIKTAEAAVDVAIELYGEDSMQLSDRDDLLLVAQEALDSFR